MTVNTYQRIMLDTYANGEFAHIASIDEAATIDDALFACLFLILSDKSGCEEISTALGRIHFAKDEMDNILKALIKAAANGQK